MYSEIPYPVIPRYFHDHIYQGDIFKFANLPAMLSLVNFARAYLEDAFYPYIPIEIHNHLSHEQQTEIFAKVERDFSQSQEVQSLWKNIFTSLGLDINELACDRLYLRFQPHQLPEHNLSRTRTTATIAFHRDTWGSNIYAQTNWWAPIYPITSGRTFAIYPELWDRPVKNTSAEFDMAQILERSRLGGRYAVKADDAIPHLTEDLDHSLGIPVTIDPGTFIAFSGAHAHAGVANATGLTRISVETRTIWINDFVDGRKAHNIDGNAKWMTPGFFKRLSDSTPLNNLIGIERLVMADNDGSINR